MSYSRKLTREIEKKKFPKNKDKNDNKIKFSTWWKLFQKEFYAEKAYIKLQAKNKKKK